MVLPLGRRIHKKIFILWSSGSQLLVCIRIPWRLVNPRLLDPTPRIPHSAGLEWVKEFAFPVSSLWSWWYWLTIPDHHCSVTESLFSDWKFGKSGTTFSSLGFSHQAASLWLVLFSMCILYIPREEKTAYDQSQASKEEAQPH